MKNDRRQTILFIIILLVLSMGIGYAFLTTTLSIDGTSDIDSSSWDVHFENVQVQSGSVTGSQVTTPATISADGQTVSYHIKLNQPGDNYVFKIDVVNDGSLSAKISNILFKINGEDATTTPEYLAQYVMYDGYKPFDVGQYLLSGQTKTLIVGIHYREDVNPEDLPVENQSLTISFGIDYSQVNSRDIPESDFSVNGYSGVYDAQYHSIIVDTSNIIPNYVLEYSIDDSTYSSEIPSIKDVGVKNVKVRATLSDGKIIVKNVVLEVTPFTITSRCPSSKKMYDGTPISDTHYTCSISTGESFEVYCDGSRTSVGTSPNVFSHIDWESAGLNSNNYVVNIASGTLTVTSAPI